VFLRIGWRWRRRDGRGDRQAKCLRTPRREVARVANVDSCDGVAAGAQTRAAEGRRASVKRCAAQDHTAML
jgi:hypothetical protein